MAASDCGDDEYCQHLAGCGTLGACTTRPETYAEGPYEETACGCDGELYYNPEHARAWGTDVSSDFECVSCETLEERWLAKYENLPTSISFPCEIETYCQVLCSPSGTPYAYDMPDGYAGFEELFWLLDAATAKLGCSKSPCNPGPQGADCVDGGACVLLE
jgi:hypothetical protein